MAGVLGSNIDFDFMRFIITDDLNLGSLGTFSYDVSAGRFLNARRVEFMDYRHFNTSQITAAPIGLRSFWALPYYEYSTTKPYIELHAEHHFNGFIFNKIPLLKKLRWQEVTGVHALWDNQIGQYIELTLGIEHIMKFFRVDLVSSFQRDRNVQTAIRFGAGF
jgi:hypothetical protein